LYRKTGLRAIIQRACAVVGLHVLQRDAILMEQRAADALSHLLLGRVFDRRPVM
jgi:hypothetical protein